MKGRKAAISNLLNRQFLIWFNINKALCCIKRRFDLIARSNEVDLSKTIQKVLIFNEGAEESLLNRSYFDENITCVQFYLIQGIVGYNSPHISQIV